MSNPAWRTSTVVALCESMRQLQDYSALPILADALEESGYDNRAMLDSLRDPICSPLWAEHFVARIYSDETEAAVKWIGEYVERLGVGGYPGGLPHMTYQMLMEAAGKFASTGDSGFGEGSMNWSNESCDSDHKFWRMWALVTARTPPKDAYEFLACSC